MKNNRKYHCGEKPQAICGTATYGVLGLPYEPYKTANELSEIDKEIEEYHEMITYSIQTNDKESLAMWRRALQTAKISKRRQANI